MPINQLYPTINPSLLLDFANTKALDPRVTFTRSSSARYYDGKTFAKAEENLLLRSQEFNQSPWVATRSTILANTSESVAPDGTLTADKITVDTSAANTHLVAQSVTLNANVHVVSVFAKKSELSWLCINTFLSTSLRTFFNLDTGTIGTTAPGHTASIINAGNGWYRCVVVFTGSSASWTFRLELANSDNNVTLDGNGVDGIIIWGAQLEQRVAVTDYIATTTSTITNYAPVLLSAANNTARFDHNPITGESLGLLIEEQRTNLLLRSEDFANATWQKFRANILSNIAIAPDGTRTASKIFDDTSDLLAHFISQSITVSGNTTYILSCYAKAGEGNRFLRLAVTGAANWQLGYSARFDLVTGTIFSTVIGNASIVPVGNGWYRCALEIATVESPPGGGAVAIQLMNTDGVATYAGDGYSGIYIWGAQLEAGSFSTSYIPTVASQATRSADTAIISGTKFSSWYRQDEGTIYSEAACLANYTDNSFYCIDDGVTSAVQANQIDVRIVSSTSYRARIRSSVTGAAVTSADLNPGSFSAGTMTRLSFGYKANDYGASINGLSTVTDTVGDMPQTSMTQFRFANRGSETTRGVFLLKKLAYYPLKLSNTQIQALSR